MKNKTRLNVLLATLIFSSLPAFAGSVENKICKITCLDIAQAFAEERDAPKPDVLSCEQKGDIDADSLTLTKGTMTCQTGYLTDTGKGEMGIEKRRTFTITIKPEETK
jgi:hypothetical protein